VVGRAEDAAEDQMADQTGKCRDGWRRMLEHYAHIRLHARKTALDRLDQHQATATRRFSSVRRTAVLKGGPPSLRTDEVESPNNRRLR
jgi:hypothetical protein